MNNGGLLCTAVLSPLSQSTAMLTVIQPTVPVHNPWVSTDNLASASADAAADLPEVVSSVLGVVYDIMEKDGDVVYGKEYFKNNLSMSCVKYCFVGCLFMNVYGYYTSDKPNDDSVPEWVQQELNQGPMSQSILETWFPQSDHSGVSSNLMESMRYGALILYKAKGSNVGLR